ncbi:hypothetical protein EU545_03410 [Candidatus Thorarchaeota archaeon]|nr:MAG: hypothetical protein EU545_03410 [Candidatus Thorarchaeota archaeon]
MQFWPSDPFSFFDMFWQFALISTIVGIFIFVLVVVIIIRVCRSSAEMAKSFTMQAPSHAIPERYQGGRSDGPDMRTVRLPATCPSCGANLSQESIDWVGPLEAKCNYCGATVRAKFEPV